MLMKIDHATIVNTLLGTGATISSMAAFLSCCGGSPHIELRVLTERLHRLRQKRFGPPA